MDLTRLLESRTIWGALGLSALLSTAILLLSPSGLPALNKQEAELREARAHLLELNKRNHELYLEVLRLSKQDPELMEALARRQGYARPGETVYTFRNPAPQK
ncbi:MAG TPA: septum formation initiator family protein [Holophagaceae bacterium]|nr:septum formation initiator family protein [Holophagaceae bacterium]